MQSYAVITYFPILQLDISVAFSSLRNKKILPC